MVPIPPDFFLKNNGVNNGVVKKDNELVKKVIAIQITDTSDLVYKADYNTKVSEIENQILDYDHDKYITTKELATKVDIVDFVKEEDFDDKLKNCNKKITLSKTAHVEVKNKLDELSKKIKVISMKRLIKDLINKHSVLKGAKYFFLAYYKNIQYLNQLINMLNFLVAAKKFVHGNLKECQKKVLKILLDQTIFFLQV